MIDLNLSDIKIKSIKQDATGHYHIYVSCTANTGQCTQCGKKLSKSHGQCEESVIEHLPILEKRVFIHVRWPRFMCEDCGVTSAFRPGWLNTTGQMSLAFEDYVLKSLINSTIKDVSEKLRLTEDAIQGIANRRIQTDYDWTEASPKAIGLDEIALRKGHQHYLTIITDISVPGATRIIAVIDGRKKEDVMPFLKRIPDRVLLNLESLCVDMSASYIPALKERINDDTFFNEIVTIDRFHVAKLVGEKVDKQRIKLTRKLKEELKGDDEALEKIKGTMWPFRHHAKDLTEAQAQQLDELFKYSDSLKQVYDLRESLYAIFEAQDLTKPTAKEAIDAWLEQAGTHEAFVGFIKTYRNFEDVILNYFTHRRSSGPVEGMNNKLKVIKRRGYGFRSVANFAKRVFLDINYKPELLGFSAA